MSLPAQSAPAGNLLAVFTRTISSNISLFTGFLITFISLYPFVYEDDRTVIEPFDMSIYYGAIKHWHESGSIYDWTYPPEHIYGFTYPPFAAIFFSPLAWFPSEASLAPLFLLANVASMIAVAILCFRALKVDQRTSWALALWLTPLLMMTFPIRQNMVMGQINMFLLLMIIFDALVLSRTRFSGILTGIAASIKMTPAIFGLYFMAKKDWGALTRFIATGICSIALSFMVDSKITLEFFTDKIFESNRVGSITEPLSFNIYGETSRLFIEPFNLILYALLALALGVLTFISVKKLHQSGQNLYAVTVMGLYMLMLSPISWNHHWVWILPALAVAAFAAGGRLDSTYMFLTISGAVIFTLRFEAWFSGNGWGIGQWPLYAVLMHMLPALWTLAFIILPVLPRYRAS